MSAPVHNKDVEVYLGNSKGWNKAHDYQKAAYLDFQQIHQAHQMYYVENGMHVNHCVGKIYPGIKQIKKKEVVDSATKQKLRSGNIIFMIRREQTHKAPIYIRSMFYMITDDGRKIPISDDPAKKLLHKAEETAKTNLDDELNKKRTKWSVDTKYADADAEAKAAAATHSDTSMQPADAWVSQTPVNMNTEAYTVIDPIDEVEDLTKNSLPGLTKNGLPGGGKRKTKQQRTNKNKRQTRQTRRYFKR